MIDGTYAIEFDTPLGRKRGSVSLEVEGASLSALVDAPFIGKQEVHGTAGGNSFSAGGTARIRLLGKVNYTVKGTVEGDVLSLAIHTATGDMNLEGKRV